MAASSARGFKASPTKVHHITNGRRAGFYQMKLVCWSDSFKTTSAVRTAAVAQIDLRTSVEQPSAQAAA